MKFTTLLSVEGLSQFLGSPGWIVIDCRFWLDDPARGSAEYQDSHIPGAIYAHLDQHLTGPRLIGQTGRHPLPPVEALSARFSAWGIDETCQVVAYDSSGGGMAAARLWWLLRWLGHEAVAVLDGGWPAWLAAHQPVDCAIPTPAPRQFVACPQPGMLVRAEDILLRFGDPGHRLYDSRAIERFRGEFEPIDPVAGHIPGAASYDYTRNLDARGHFQGKQVLRGRFQSLFGDVPAGNVTFYCGSGVTAAHNVLAVAHSGLGMPALYAGSWSEWIADPNRPVATGEA